MKRKYEGKFNGAGSIVAALAASDPQLDRYIGCIVEHKDFAGISYEEAGRRKMHGYGRAGKLRIIGVKKIYNGQLAFRVVNTEWKDTFGYPLRLEETHFLPQA